MANMEGPAALLVEDNDYYREEVRRLLAAEFPALNILEATEGQEAFRKSEEYRPSLILMDIALPGKNGLQLARKIKAAHPETIIAMLTSYDAMEYREAAEASGADHFLVKDNATSADIIDIIKLVFDEPSTQ